MIEIATCQGEALRLRGTRLTLKAQDYAVSFILSVSGLPTKPHTKFEKMRKLKSAHFTR